MQTGFKPRLLNGGGGGGNLLVEVTVNTKEENSDDFFTNYVQEFGLRAHTTWTHPSCVASFHPGQFDFMKKSQILQGTATMFQWIMTTSTCSPSRLFSTQSNRDDIFKLSGTPGIGSKVLIPSAYVNLLKRPGIDSQHGRPVRHPYLTYWPARLVHRLADSLDP